MSFSVAAPFWIWEAGTIAFGGDYPLQLTLASDVIPFSPASLRATVSNGPPNAQITFTCSGSSAPDLVTNLDESGTATLISVPIAVAVPGTYVLVVFAGDPGTTGDGDVGSGFIGFPDTSGTTESAEFASANFVVENVATSGGITVPTPSPPTNVQTDPGVKKWVFQDPSDDDEVYHFAINPVQMTSPFGPRSITYQATTAIDGQKLAWEGQRAAVQWQFQGHIKTQAQYDAFVHWSNKPKRIWITDHFGRAWLSYITSFAPVPVRDTSSYWTHTYQMDVLIFDGPVTPS